MDHTTTMRSLMLSGLLSCFLATPVMADDVIVIDPPSQAAEPAREPVYKWQGNTITERGQLASTPATPPQASESGGVRFITGGIGLEEREAIEAVKNSYNLRVTSSDKDGAFDGDTKITILSKNGESLVSTDAGPLFYAELSPGPYTVEAVSSGRSKKQRISVSAGKTSNVYFRW